MAYSIDFNGKGKTKSGNIISMFGRDKTKSEFDKKLSELSKSMEHFNMNVIVDFRVQPDKKARGRFY